MCSPHGRRALAKVALLVHFRLQALTSQNNKKMIDIHSPFTLPCTEIYYGMSSDNEFNLKVCTHN